MLDLQGNKHPLVQNRQIIIAAWKVTGNPLKRKEFQAMQPSLYASQEDWVLLSVTDRSQIIGIAGMLGKKQIHCVHL